VNDYYVDLDQALERYAWHVATMVLAALAIGVLIGMGLANRRERRSEPAAHRREEKP
jgi:hypothetical protein